jgi:hypothetical protein
VEADQDTLFCQFALKSSSTPSYSPEPLAWGSWFKTQRVGLGLLPETFLGWLCAEGPRVLQLGGGTRELFYYPRETVLVTAIGDSMDTGTQIIEVCCATGHCTDARA